MNSTSSGRCGFTLIESLAVIIVVSLVAAVGGMSLANGNDQVRMQAAEAAWQDLDAMARLHARAGKSIRMILDRQGAVVTLWPNESDTPLSQIDMPNGGRAQMYIDGNQTNDILIERGGRSVDYRVELRSEHSSQKTIAWRTCGLTGWVTEEEVSQ